MAETLSLLPPSASASVTLEIVPTEGEEDDLDTLAVIGQVQVDVQREVAHLDAYTVTTLPVREPEKGARGLDIILLITFIGASIAAYKDLLTYIFQTVSTLIEVLAKQGRVQEVEIIADGRYFLSRRWIIRTFLLFA